MKLRFKKQSKDAKPQTAEDNISSSAVDEPATMADPVSPEPESSDTSTNQNDTAEPAESTPKTTDSPNNDSPKAAKFQKPKSHSLIALIRRHPKRSIAASILIAIIIILMAVPLTRNAVLGLVLKQNVDVLALDDQTGQAISSATVSIGNNNTATDKDGKATLKVHLGKRTVLIQKKYYKDFSQKITVGVTKAKQPLTLKVTATGRQVPIVITNKISGAKLSDITIKTADTVDKTDKTGSANVVLPANKATVDATLSGQGYIDLKVTLKVTTAPENNFSLTPSGKVYFLSKLSGKIDVVKTNLDGSDRQTVLAGTGTEDEFQTILLASRDWKYLALLAHRDGKLAKLYLIETATDKLSAPIDEGDATFLPVGWFNEHFVYTVARNNVKNWLPKGQALKTYNAATKQLTTIDETDGEGTNDNDYAFSLFSTKVFILNNEIVYSKNWYTTYYSSTHLNGKSVNLYSVKPDGTGKKTVKAFTIPDGTSGTVYLDLRNFEPQSIIVFDSQASNYYVYSKGALTANKDITNETVNNKFYPTYLISPSDNQTFWDEPRDGKNSIFVGDVNGSNPSQLTSLSEFSSYGWYTEDYVLVSKDNSELYIAPAKKGADFKPLKITDYHKPQYDFSGYGYGYGGGN